MIQVKSLDKEFGSARVLDNIHFDVAPGEFVSFVGPSGCGKSTLLRIVAGLESATRGTVKLSLDGATLANRSGVAFVFQQPTLLPWRTVLSNVGLPLELRGQSNVAIETASRRVLDLVGLATSDHRKLPGTLSGGMRMRVSLARALVTQPKALLMDEPFAAVDDILRQQLNEELQAAWQETGCTVLFVTHNIAEAVFLSQRIFVMSRSPATISQTIEVPFGYPRDVTLRESGEFARICGKILRSLRGG